MIFRAFFDESGVSPHENKALVMGGFVGHVDEWKRASEAWDECLQESPSINYFSRNEANTLDGEFLRFSRASADVKVKNLARVIARFLLQGFCVSVPHSWFANRDAKASKGMIGSRAYDWGFLTVTSGVLQCMSKLRVDYRVDFIFDERTELRACIGMYDEMKNSGAAELAHAGACLPGDDKKLAALQMADLLAGKFSHLSENGPPPLEPFSIIATAKRVIHVPCTPPRLIPDTLEIQKLGADVKSSAQSLLKRIYGDEENSLEVLRNTAALQTQKAFFDLQFQRLCGLSNWQKKVSLTRHSNIKETDMKAVKTKKELSSAQREELLQALQARFEKNRNRHEGLEWAKVKAKLEANPGKLGSLSEMEKTGGEPDVVGHDKKTGEYIFFDCSPESPKDRRSFCYDREALDSRKEAKPKNNAMEAAAAMGIELLTEEQYRELQKLGEFDIKTSSWLKTPAEMRKLGGALFGDRRFGRVFLYHNGAESYYAARAFRGWLRV